MSTTQTVTDAAQVHHRPPNEMEAEAALHAAIAAHGPNSAPAECARRHLRLICRFNAQNAWVLH